MRYTYNKKHAIKIITECAKIYKSNLVGNKVLFVYKNSFNKIETVEVKFQEGNFLHLTGIIPTPNAYKTSTRFFRAALAGKIRESDFSLSGNGNTVRKLEVLPKIMTIDSCARMIGEYNGPRIDLHTEKITGTTTACLGLLKAGTAFVPNTVLNEDIRKVIPKPPGKIVAIFKKPIKQTDYTTCTYDAKNINLKQIILLLPSLTSAFDKARNGHLG